MNKDINNLQKLYESIIDLNFSYESFKDLFISKLAKSKRKEKDFIKIVNDCLSKIYNPDQNDVQFNEIFLDIIFNTEQKYSFSTIDFKGSANTVQNVFNIIQTNYDPELASYKKNIKKISKDIFQGKNYRIILGVDGTQEAFQRFLNDPRERELLDLHGTLYHELVHLNQYKRIYEKNPNWLPSTKIDTNASYYGDVHEIMAHASTVAIELINKWHNKKDILDIIKNPNLVSKSLLPYRFKKYRKVFGVDSPTYKQFIKYIVSYIDKAL